MRVVPTTGPQSRPPSADRATHVRRHRITFVQHGRLRASSGWASQPKSIRCGDSCFTGQTRLPAGQASRGAITSHSIATQANSPNGRSCRTSRRGGSEPSCFDPCELVSQVNVFASLATRRITPQPEIARCARRGAPAPVTILCARAKRALLSVSSARRCSATPLPGSTRNATSVFHAT